MNAGDLNHVIRLEQPVETQDPDSGEISTTWSTFVDNMPASVGPVSGKEFVAAQATQSQVDTLIAFWWLPGVTAKMRVVDIGEGVTYNIAGVLPDNVNGRCWITLACQAGITDGR